MEKLLFDIEQISNYLSIKEKTIYSKVEKNEIPHYKIGRLIRFKKDEIDQWMESCRQAKKLEAEQQKIKKNRNEKTNRRTSGTVTRTIKNKNSKRGGDTLRSINTKYKLLDRKV